MFSESEGPTALRQDLIHALALSVGTGEVSGPSGPEPACGGLSAVWNGRKGYVAVLVRSLRTQTIRRFTYSEAIRSEVELDAAVEEGLAFAESFGFGMDDPTFFALSAKEQQDRVVAWNQLRKANRYPEFVRPYDRSDEPDTNPGTIDLPAPVSDSGGAEGAEDPEAAPALGRSEPEVDEDPDGKAVLGRISIIRRQAAGPRARLLSQF